MCNNIPRPALLPIRSTYYFFKEDIQPAWEDPKNEGGGALKINLRTPALATHSELIFLQLLLLVISNTLPNTEWINGITFSKTKDVVEVWLCAGSRNQDMLDNIMIDLNAILKSCHILTFPPSLISYCPFKR